MQERNYNYNAYVNDVANGITLRSDIHRCLDRHGFVFLPAGNKEFMTYVVGDTETNYVGMLHRRLVTIPTRVVDESLYAHFAYCIVNQKRDPDFATIALPVSAAVERARAREGAGKRKRSLLSPVAESEEKDSCAYAGSFLIW